MLRRPGPCFGKFGQCFWRFAGVDVMAGKKLLIEICCSG